MWASSSGMLAVPVLALSSLVRVMTSAQDFEWTLSGFLRRVGECQGKEEGLNWIEKIAIQRAHRALYSGAGGARPLEPRCCCFSPKFPLAGWQAKRTSWGIGNLLCSTYSQTLDG